MKFEIIFRLGESDQTWIPIICLLLYVCTSMIGLLTIPWTMTAELFPNEIRGIAHSISYSMANLLMFFAVQSYRWRLLSENHSDEKWIEQENLNFRGLTDILGGPHAIQYFFAGVSIIGFFFGLVFLPETFGKKLSDIEKHFSSKKPTKPKRTKQTNGVNNRKPKPTLETVKEAEKMIKEPETV